MKQIVIGILAHVDAGKTTLSEGLLYLAGNIRKLGRVDHKDAFLDTYELERERGITIFSKQAVFSYGNLEVTLLDTPGHTDFSAEMERTLRVLDYAVLVINGTDGVQGHTLTLWKLLQRYQIPVFLFVNKMDLHGSERQTVLLELQKKLSDACIDFTEKTDNFYEQIAVTDEHMLETYMESGMVEDSDISELIRKRKVFPCFFGAALKLEGVEEFLVGLDTYTLETDYPHEFGAKVFKINRDDQKNRLTFLKVTGGSLKVKMLVKTKDGKEEKIDQIRIYSGTKFETKEEVPAGTICAVTGLLDTYAGLGMGIEKDSEEPVLEPVLTYRILLPEGSDVHGTLLKLKELEEEDPQLHIVWNEHLKEIHAQVMGEIQIEILKSMILERFGIAVEFGTGNIVYKETIQNTVIGVGHFEPLRHYAEAHLLLEPLENGKGLEFGTNCSTDELDGNWQRLILTHLYEKQHLGVLAGFPVTDMRITLIAGRAHLKHTEGGDFRQATYRAVRNGLKKAKSILLEPYYHFQMELPQENLGRAMTDIQKMCGNFEPPVTDGEVAVLSGSCPVSTMHNYNRELISYTKGMGKLFCELEGYKACHNAEEVIEQIGYDSESDLENPAGSVFCAHGAGFAVRWDEVCNYQHLHPESDMEFEVSEPQETQQETKSVSKKKEKEFGVLDKELEQIFERTFGPVKRRLYSEQESFGYEKRQKPEKAYVAKWENKTPVKKYLLVDGYNLLFSWEELHELAKANLDAARGRLMDILCNYQGFHKYEVILVFDAYKVKGNTGEVSKYHNIHVVYTREAQTADAYIEKTTHELAKKHDVTVVTSDALEQLIIMGQGGRRVSSREFQKEIEEMEKQLRDEWLKD